MHVLVAISWAMSLCAPAGVPPRGDPRLIAYCGQPPRVRLYERRPLELPELLRPPRSFR